MDAHKTLLYSRLSNSSTKHNGVSSRPSAKDYEIVLARKILARSKSLFNSFQRLDYDGDGSISKHDLIISLHEMYGIHLDDNQIETIFQRALELYSSVHHMNPTPEDKGKEPLESPSSKRPSPESELIMTFPMFQMYIEQTANVLSPSSKINSSEKDLSKETLYKFPSQKKSLAAKSKYLRSLVLQLIEQSTPTGNMSAAATRVFLEMNTSRSNRVTKKQFKDWLENVHGIYFDEEEINILMTPWKKEEGLSPKEFAYFLSCLRADTNLKSNSCPCSSDEEMMKRLVVNQDLVEHRSPISGGTLVKDQFGDDDHKTNDELVRALLQYFQTTGKTIVKGFHFLDRNDSKALGAYELSLGFKQAGFDVSVARSKLLVSRHVLQGGYLSKPNFVRLMTSHQM